VFKRLTLSIWEQVSDSGKHIVTVTPGRMNLMKYAGAQQTFAKFISSLSAWSQQLGVHVSIIFDAERFRHTSWNNNDDEQDDYSYNQAHPHFHITPPHLLSNSIGAATESLS
jgi:hypothetical protein